jgi:hypothetical protein
VNITTGGQYTIQNSGARLRINSAPASLSGYQYRCLVSTAQCAAQTSSVLTLTVNPLPVILASNVVPVSCNGGTNGFYIFQPSAGNYVYGFSTGATYSGPAPATIALPANLIQNLAAGTYTLRLQDAVTACFIDSIFTVIQPAPITFTTTVQDVSCNGGTDGTITVNAVGGSGNYQYSLNGGMYQPGNVFTGLISAGMYLIRVRDVADPNCVSGPQPATVGEPAPLALAPVVMDLSCFEAGDGMITPVASGGTPLYTYNWSGPNGYTGNFSSVLLQNNFDTDRGGFVDFGNDYVDVDPLLANGSIVNEYWSQNTASDRGLTFFKSAQNSIVYWEVVLTNTTSAAITDLAINYDFEVPWIANNNTGRNARLSWQVDLGTPVLSSIITNSATAPDSTWLTDAQMNTFNLALRNQTVTFAGLNIAPGATFTIRVTGATDAASRRDMNHGIDNLSVIATNFNGKISNLAAGDYNLTLTDAKNCVLQQTIAVAQPNELTITLDAIPQICADDLSFTIPYSAVGGLTNRYQIQNDPAFNGLDAGNLTLTNTGFQVLGASPLSIGLNSVPPAAGEYRMLITPRSTAPTCTGDPIPFTVYVPDPNSNPVAQTDTICSGAAAVFDVTTTELGVPSSIRWAYQVGVDPVSPVFTAAFDGNGDAQISQVLTNNTASPITATFFFRGYTFGPDGVDNMGDALSDDCREDPANSVVITILPEPAGTATATPIPATARICSGSSAVINVNTTILGGSSYKWSSTNGGSATSVPFTTDISEPVTNNTNDNVLVTYTITPYTFGPNGVDDGGAGDDCLGNDITQIFTVEPAPQATATALAATICSGDDAEIDVNTTLAIANTRYRWRYREGTGAWSAYTNNVQYSTNIVQALTNVTTASVTFEFDIRPYTFGPNGNNNNGGSDDCTGTPVSVFVTVLPAPVLMPPSPDIPVCSDQPLNFSLPATSSNSQAIATYDIAARTYSNPLSATWLAISEVSLPVFDETDLAYFSSDTYRNLTAATRTVTYTVTPVSIAGCVGAPTNYIFRIRTEPKVVQLPDTTVCSGDVLALSPVGYYGTPVPPIPHNPDITFNISISGSAGLTDLDGNDLNGLTCVAAPFTGESWGNPTDAPVTVTYTITPVRGCGTASECSGDPISFTVTIEPDPTADFVINLDGVDYPVNNLSIFTACSEADFSVTGMTSTVPSNAPTEQVWARVRLWGDVDALGFPGPVLIGNSIFLHGPISTLNLGSTNLDNPTSAVKVINVRIIPYIETTPSLDPINNPQTLNGAECEGSAINFQIRINPEAAHVNQDTVVCSDEALGLMLMPSNNAALGVQIAEDTVFNDPSQLHNWVVPQGVTQVTIEAQGGDGGSGMAKGGSGAYVIADFSVSQGDQFDAIIGQAGKNFTGTGGGGGGSGVERTGTPLVFAGGGGGGGSSTIGGGGQGIGASNATGGGGANNGGGGGGSYNGSNGSTGAGNGGQGGFAGFGATGGDGFGNNGDGGTGTGGGGGGGALGGGGGGGFTGGNGGIGTFGLGGFGGSSNIDINGSNGSVTPGVNGAGDGNNGFVRISWIRTLPPVKYTITDIDYDANSVQDGDGIDRSVAPDNMGIANLSNESDLIAGEQWINTSNTAQTVVYTIQPDTDTQCGGEPFTVTVTVEPVAMLALSGMGIVEDMPNMAYSLELCSKDTLMATINSSTVPSTGLGQVRYRLIDVDVDDNNGDAIITRTSVFGFPDMTVALPLPLGSGNSLPIGLKELLTNTGTASGTVTYTFRPIILDGTNGDCPGKDVTLTVTVNPEPVLSTPSTVEVCSNAPLSSVFQGFPTTSDVNNVTLSDYEVVNVIVDPLLTAESGPSLGLNADISSDRFRNLTTTTTRFVTYQVVFFSANGDCVSDTVDFVFQINREARVSGPIAETVCSDNYLTSEYIGYFGPTVPVSHNNTVGLRIEFNNPNGLIYNGQNSYIGNAIACAAPNALLQDRWINNGTTPAQITYTITPVRQCGTLTECDGAPITLVVTVEPTPVASVDVAVGNDPVVTVDASNTPQTFEFCSGESFLATAQFAGTSLNNNAQWIRVRLTGDVQLFGFASSPAVAFGPASSFIFGGGPLVNTSGSPEAVTVQILPYFETNPGGANPNLNNFECSGQQITFNVIVNPGPVFSDVDTTLCSDAVYGVDLDPANLGVGQNITVDESVEFNYTGSLQNWTVPEGVTSIKVIAIGADGGNSANHSGGSGTTAERSGFAVNPGDVFNIIPGRTGNNGPAAGGGGGTGVTDGLSNIVIVAGGGGGAGLNNPGIGGASNGVGTTGGAGGANNGGGGGGGFTGAGANGSGGAAGGNLGFGAAGGATPNAGGYGVAGGGAGSNLAGGGGGGYGGGNGGLGTFGAGGAGGTSFSGTPATPGATGGGTGANGKVIIEYTRTLPPVQYVINSINDGGLADADGTALMSGDTGEEDILANEAWTNSGNTAVDVVYNMSTTSSQACPGSSFDVTMTIEPTPRMELVGVTTVQQYASYTHMVCSDEQLNIPLSTPTLPSGGLNQLRYRLVDVVVDNGVDGNIILQSSPIPPLPFNLGNGTQNVALDQVWSNTGTTEGTVTYTLRARINNAGGDCLGELVTFVLTVKPEPTIITPPTMDVCSNAPLSSVFAGFPTTSTNPLSIASYEVIEVLSDIPPLNPIAGPTMGVNADISSDTYENLTTDNDQFVTYRVVFFTQEGCASDTINYVFRITREARIDGPTEETVCSDGSLSSEFIGYFGPTVPVSHNAGVSFRITYSNPDGLTYTGSNVYDGNNTLDCAGPAALLNDSWTNTGSGPAQITYTITPVRQCLATPCLGVPLTFTATIEPEVALSLTLTHSGIPAGPQTIDANNAPATTPLALTICAESPFDVAIGAASMPSANAEQWVRVFIADPGALLPSIMVGTNVMPLDSLASFLSFPNGIPNPGALPSTIQFRIRPFFNQNGDNVIDPNECQGDPAFGYDLTVESGVFAAVIVQPNPGADDEVCSDETFTIRLRKTAPSVPVTAYRVWVEIGAGLTQTSVAPVSTDAHEPDGIQHAGSIAQQPGHF